MTRYEHGFLNKCAERGVDGRLFLAKLAQDAANADTTPASDKPGFLKRTGDAVRGAYDATKNGLGKAYDWSASQLNSAGNWMKDPNHAAGTGAIGGGAAGALALLLHEAMRRRRGPNDRKDYLKKILLGLVLGSAGGAVAGHYHTPIANTARTAGTYMTNLGKAIVGKK